MLGKYCAYDFENWQYNSGSKIIKEQLHQYAIFKKRGVDKWFEYMNLFDEYCEGNWMNLDPCIQTILKKMNLKDTSMPNPDETIREWKIR